MSGHVNPEVNVILSRVRNGARDTAMALAAFRKADDRLAIALREAREAGVSSNLLYETIASAAKGNPRVRDAVEEYARMLKGEQRKNE